MQRRLEREDFMRAGRLIIGASESGRLKVCEKYEIRGDEILAKWPQQEESHWWMSLPVNGGTRSVLGVSCLHEASDFPEAAPRFQPRRRSARRQWILRASRQLR